MPTWLNEYINSLLQIHGHQCIDLSNAKKGLIHTLRLIHKRPDTQSASYTHLYGTSTFQGLLLHHDHWNGRSFFFKLSVDNIFIQLHTYQSQIYAK